MKLPTDSPRNFVLELRQTLMGSMAERRHQCANWDALFYAGATLERDRAPAIANIVTSRIRTQANNLWSPDNVTWRLEREIEAEDEILAMDQSSGSYLSRELREADADLEFGDAVELALRHGSSFIQLTWDGETLCADVIPQWAVGVTNEKAKGLYGRDQGAFMVSYTIPMEQFAEIVRQFKGTDDLARAFDGSSESTLQVSEATKVVLGLNQPIGNISGSQAGFINLLPRPAYIPGSNARGRQVSVDAIWMQREDGRWASVYVIEGNETIGTDIWRNFLALDGGGNENPDLAKRHPYTYVCPNPTKGQIFGRSSIADIAEAQNFVRLHGAGMDHILRMQEDPAHIGFGAVQPAEIYRQQLREPGGFVSETGPNAKVTPQIPQMPNELIPALEIVANWASDAAGQPPVVQGRGEHGVRAGAHAETLLSAASSRERRPALRTVRQAGDMGDLAIEILRVKDGSEISLSDGGTFILESLTSGYHVYCNGHTASPLFAAEYVALADDLLKAGAIGPEEYLEMRNPVGLDTLRRDYQKRQKQQQQVVQSLPPEDRVKVITGSAHHRR